MMRARVTRELARDLGDDCVCSYCGEPLDWGGYETIYVVRQWDAEYCSKACLRDGESDWMAAAADFERKLRAEEPRR